ncbi:MAG: hypothetical protein PHT32_04395, partial [Candidatus Omnitrophica bacterium]|nr:hypothetical protein [Candidatus Omnitrophota bacterium]
MKAVARQFLILAVFFAVWYMSAIALSYAFFPQTVIPKPVDTQEADRTIYQVPSRYITMCMPNFAKSADKKIFIVGSSNAREGFRPEELEEYAPGREIFNLGMGSSNITQARDTADLVCAVFPESSIKGSVFVLGIWYGLFVTDDMRWGRKPPDLVT